ncbi:hypothetical protein NG800_013325 [Epilithonimonas ginsengisoli]|uniref:Uncharacterized protein n=1 Tax=Epilithonimonas ginsengisoli TaxID=1245592 RepID=A0ABU4JJN1_9FLAO|nr:MULTISPECIES: hypothetical protein [Chryseobacterium group]MBV6881010.1 hypothetical protein [Epilithonimonas sp. FP105]MDW8549900.1 hypothetical protein [Epilithonimonas ginsengisoli]OAH73514.1 hypothetical protein AXA65_07170 [Chryseobacterium sp. FP211-J200]
MKVLISFLFFLSNILFSQIRLTYEKDIEVYFLGNEISRSQLLSGNTDYNFKVKNNTPEYLIISRYGFKKQNYIISEKEVVSPDSIFLAGYPAELENEECRENIFILKPHSEMEIKGLDMFEILANYKLEKSKKYMLVTSSHFKPSYAKLELFGCADHIKKLESKKYRFANFLIFAEIPLVN